jgi:hypothetical protein
MTIGEILPNNHDILGVVLVYNRKTGTLESVTTGFADDPVFRDQFKDIVPNHFVGDKASYIFFTSIDGEG